jgi:hypothetical protein
MIRKYQKTVKVCSVLPITGESGPYEYLPETAVTKAEYEEISRKISQKMDEDVDMDSVTQCEKCLVQ